MKSFIKYIEFANKYRNKHERIINTIIASIVIIALLIFVSSCSIVKPNFIESEEIQIEYFEFDDYARKIHHINDRKEYTASLNWADVAALDIDSVTAKYIEYRKYHLRIKSVYR